MSQSSFKPNISQKMAIWQAVSQMLCTHKKLLWWATASTPKKRQKENRSLLLRFGAKAAQLY